MPLGGGGDYRKVGNGTTTGALHFISVLKPHHSSNRSRQGDGKRRKASGRSCLRAFVMACTTAERTSTGICATAASSLYIEASARCLSARSRRSAVRATTLDGFPGEMDNRAPRKIAAPCRMPQNCLRMISFRSRSDSLTFTPRAVRDWQRKQFFEVPNMRIVPSLPRGNVAPTTQHGFTGYPCQSLVFWTTKVARQKTALRSCVLMSARPSRGRFSSSLAPLRGESDDVGRISRGNGQYAHSSLPP